jgi:hypothetical protein
MSSAANHNHEVDCWVCIEPAAQGGNLGERAEPSGKHMLHVHFLEIERDEVVALWRRHFLSHLQKIQGGGQRHFRETAYLEAAHAEQEPWRETLAEELQGVFLTMHSSGEDKNQIGASRGICL